MAALNARSVMLDLYINSATDFPNEFHIAQNRLHIIFVASPASKTANHFRSVETSVLWESRAPNGAMIMLDTTKHASSGQYT